VKKIGAMNFNNIFIHVYLQNVQHDTTATRSDSLQKSAESHSPSLYHKKRRMNAQLSPRRFTVGYREFMAPRCLDDEGV
jgi:hypothetical protein